MTEIKDRGIILYRTLLRDDDLMVHILSQHHGRLAVYAFKGAASKRRFQGCCQVFHHVQFHAQKSKVDIWNLKETELLNFFPHLTTNYSIFEAASRGAALIRKLAPLEHPNDLLYKLLGAFLQTLSTPNDLTGLLTLFEIKALQYAGIFSLGESCSACGRSFSAEDIHVSADGVICMKCCAYSLSDWALNSEEQTLIRYLLVTHALKSLFDPSMTARPVFRKLRPLMDRICADYGLSSDFRKPTAGAGHPA